MVKITLIDKEGIKHYVTFGGGKGMMWSKTVNVVMDGNDMEITMKPPKDEVDKVLNGMGLCKQEVK